MLADELHTIAMRPEVKQFAAFQAIEIHAGAVKFSSATPAAAYAANLHSRIANRVLMQLHHARYKNEQDIYKQTLSIEWERFFDSQQTFRVDLTASRSPLTSLNFATLRIKDAICDRFRSSTNARPDIDTRSPDVRVYAHLNAQDLTVYLDTSGEPLFKRGWRLDKGEAPLKENLAAGILRLSGWQPQQTLFDPMCGSGTFLIEAAQIACNIAAGSARSFAFEKNKLFQPKTWATLRNQALAEVKHDQNLSHIMGSDISGDMLALTRSNWKRAGLPSMVELKQVDARFLQTPSAATPGIMLLNPPYGERIAVRGRRFEQASKSHAMSEPIRHSRTSSTHSSPDLNTNDDLSDAASNEFASAFAKSLKQSFAGWEVYVFTGDLTFPKRLRLKESRRIPLFNGPIECRLFYFPIVAGSAR